MRKLLDKYGPGPFLLVGLLVAANVWALAQPFFYDPAEILEWRKGPLIYAHSPYASANARRIFWPVAALLADLFAAFALFWFVRIRPRLAGRRLLPLLEGLASLGGLVTVLVVGELVTRLVIGQFFFQQYRPDPDLNWTNRPDLRDHVDSSDSVPRSTNSLGFRGAEEVPEERDPAEYRVLVLGDSSAFGYGVADDETFAAVMEAHLAEALDRPVRVINTGCPGHTSFQGLRILERYGPEMTPDLVVWTYNNDPCLDTAEDKDRVAGNGVVRALQRVLYRSDLYLLFRRVSLDLVYGWKVEEYRRKFPSEQEGWVRRIPIHDYHAYLERFLALPRTWGGRTLFVRMPLNRPICAERPIYYTSFDDGYRDDLATFCAEHGADYVDFEALFATPYDPENYLVGHLFHPSVQGHRIIGEGLANYVLEKGLATANQ